MTKGVRRTHPKVVSDGTHRVLGLDLAALGPAEVRHEHHALRRRWWRWMKGRWAACEGARCDRAAERRQTPSEPHHTHLRAVLERVADRGERRVDALRALDHALRTRKRKEGPQAVRGGREDHVADATGARTTARALPDPRRAAPATRHPPRHTRMRSSSTRGGAGIRSRRTHLLDRDVEVHADEHALARERHRVNRELAERARAARARRRRRRRRH